MLESTEALRAIQSVGTEPERAPMSAASEPSVQMDAELVRPHGVLVGKLTFGDERDLAEIMIFRENRWPALRTRRAALVRVGRRGVGRLRRQVGVPAQRLDRSRVAWPPRGELDADEPCHDEIPRDGPGGGTSSAAARVAARYGELWGANWIIPPYFALRDAGYNVHLASQVVPGLLGRDLDCLQDVPEVQGALHKEAQGVVRVNYYYAYHRKLPTSYPGLMIVLW